MIDLDVSLARDAFTLDVQVVEEHLHQHGEGQQQPHQVGLAHERRDLVPVVAGNAVRTGHQAIAASHTQIRIVSNGVLRVLLLHRPDQAGAHTGRFQARIDPLDT